jgi:hypothetical protein
MRKRLEELSWQTQPLNNRDHEEAGEVSEPKRGEIIASQPVSLTPQKRKEIA